MAVGAHEFVLGVWVSGCATEAVLGYSTLLQTEIALIRFLTLDDGSSACCDVGLAGPAGLEVTAWSRGGGGCKKEVLATLVANVCTKYYKKV